MKPEPITLCRRIFREKASKQTFGINQNLVILPNISVPIAIGITATSPTPILLSDSKISASTQDLSSDINASVPIVISVL
jgi:hypothetical protein